MLPHGPLVKGLRHRPFTAVTRVRIPYGSFIRRHSQEVRQRTATPLPPVQIRVAPFVHNFHYAQVAELVDAQDLKSCGSNTVPVRFRPWASRKHGLFGHPSGSCFFWILGQSPVFSFIILSKTKLLSVSRKNSFNHYLAAILSLNLIPACHDTKRPSIHRLWHLESSI